MNSHSRSHLEMLEAAQVCVLVCVCESVYIRMYAIYINVLPRKIMQLCTHTYVKCIIA